ncbi:hypothetical protein AAFF_G00246410 [Aldrovandia affinis]|uniref:Uncharacterized protein n=1 Tax=Aldrovandia affinis TaxID=143900 RepID=A0AAD7WTT6_9TELE|nr:hypothetical protein AAFF_G00246410 [Aldrovandia affinis]
MLCCCGASDVAESMCQEIRLFLSLLPSRAGDPTPAPPRIRGCHPLTASPHPTPPLSWRQQPFQRLLELSRRRIPQDMRQRKRFGCLEGKELTRATDFTNSLKQEQEMDQGGLKYSNNQDESLTFGNPNGREGRAFQWDPSSAMSTSLTSVAPQAVPVDVSNGLGKSTPREELTTAVSASMGLYTEEPDAKAMGNNLRTPKQQQQQQQQQKPWVYSHWGKTSPS